MTPRTIVSALLRTGLSTRQIARQARVSHTTIAQIATDPRRDPKSSTADKLRALWERSQPHAG